MTETLFAPPLAFLKLPLSQDFKTARIALLGIPFDCGKDPNRFGCRLGPNAIRHASVLTAELLSDAKPSPLLTGGDIIDAGDVHLPLDNIVSAFDSIERAMRAILEAGCVPVAVGGDGAVSLPQLRAVARSHGPVALLHFDAHTDAWPLSAPDHYDNATQFTHAMHEGLLDMAHAIHIGVRGPVNAVQAIEHARTLGYEVIPFEQVRAWGEERLLAHLS